MNLSTGTNTAFVGSSWNDKISSVKIGPGIKCTFYNDRDFKGSTLAVGPNEVIYDLSSRGFNDKVSSIKCTACQ
jgi:hypothetical protein